MSGLATAPSSAGAVFDTSSAQGQRTRVLLGQARDSCCLGPREVCNAQGRSYSVTAGVKHQPRTGASHFLCIHVYIHEMYASELK